MNENINNNTNNDLNNDVNSNNNVTNHINNDINNINKMSGKEKAFVSLSIANGFFVVPFMYIFYIASALGDKFANLESASGLTIGIFIYLIVSVILFFTAFIYGSKKSKLVKDLFIVFILFVVFLTITMKIVSAKV